MESDSLALAAAEHNARADNEYLLGEIERLRREVAERMRVNVGLLAENKMLRRLHADRSGFERQIAGALRDAINQHGPLQPREIGSASKRIVKQVYAWLRARQAEDVERLRDTTEERIAARFATPTSEVSDG